VFVIGSLALMRAYPVHQMLARWWHSHPSCILDACAVVASSKVAALLEGFYIKKDPLGRNLLGGVYKKDGHWKCHENDRNPAYGDDTQWFFGWLFFVSVSKHLQLVSIAFVEDEEEEAGKGEKKGWCSTLLDLCLTYIRGVGYLWVGRRSSG
jgi:hypothetical protein